MGTRILDHIWRWSLRRSFPCLSCPVAVFVFVFPTIPIELGSCPGTDYPAPPRSTPPVRRPISPHVNEPERVRVRETESATESAIETDSEHRDT